MNFISITVYILLALSLAVGLKIAPRRAFNQDSLSLDAMTCLKGVMALFVLFHHLSQKKLFHQTGTIGLFEYIGFLFVGVFFMASGYGLYKSFVSKPDYLKGFVKRRILPIVISYYVMIAVYAVYHFVSASNFTPFEWAFKLSGLVLINTQSWFIPVIILMYLAFYFVFRSENLRKFWLPILLSLTLFQGLLFCVMNHFAWYAGEAGWWQKPGAFENLPWWKNFCALPFEGEWWVNSTIGFVFGIALAKHEDAFFDWLSKLFAAKFLALILIFFAATVLGFFCMWNIGYWTEFGGNLGFKNKLICYLAQSLQVVCTNLLIVVLMRKVYVKNRLYAFFGKRSLELYLMQEIALFGWLFLIEQNRTPIFKPHNWNVTAYMLLVMATVIASATVYSLINKRLSKFLLRK